VKTLLLLSILYGAVAIPALTARDPNPPRGIKRMLLVLCLFNAAYLVYVSWIHPEIFVPRW